MEGQVVLAALIEYSSQDTDLLARWMVLGEVEVSKHCLEAARIAVLD